jgi:hypothetical protein
MSLPLERTVRSALGGELELEYRSFFGRTSTGSSVP